MSDDRPAPDPRYGPWKFIHEIELEDSLQYPIWLWCMALGLPDEDDGPIGGNETSMRPLISSRNVTSDMHLPFILLRVKNTGYYALGLYEPKLQKLDSVTINLQHPNEITKLTKVGGLAVPEGWEAPIQFIAVPSIDGEEGVEFVCDTLDHAEAFRINRVANLKVLTNEATKGER
jgi:hypothetical protein